MSKIRKMRVLELFASTSLGWSLPDNRGKMFTVLTPSLSNEPSNGFRTQEVTIDLVTSASPYDGQYELSHDLCSIHVLFVQRTPQESDGLNGSVLMSSILSSLVSSVSVPGVRPPSVVQTHVVRLHVQNFPHSDPDESHWCKPWVL